MRDTGQKPGEWDPHEAVIVTQMNVYLKKRTNKIRREENSINKSKEEKTSTCGFFRSVFQPSSLLKPTPITLLTS